MNNYEAMFILDPNLDDASKESVVTMVKGVIEKDGEVIETKDMGVKKLAYPIEGKKTGHYYLITFKGSTALPAEIDRRLWISESVMRRMIVNTDEK